MKHDHMARRNSVALLALALAVVPIDARAASPDPDWPCQSIKVGSLSLASVWDGPAADAFLAHWSDDADVASLVQHVVPRRVPLQEAQAAIRGFAAGLGERRNERLLMLVAGLFDTLNQERSIVLAGLDRFGRRQRQLADSIHADMARLRRQPQDASTQLQDQLGWEVRLFEQRRQSAATACNVPTVIEQRLFALVRTVREAMP
jgi:hypothetical protein